MGFVLGSYRRRGGKQSACDDGQTLKVLGVFGRDFVAHDQVEFGQIAENVNARARVYFGAVREQDSHGGIFVSDLFYFTLVERFFKRRSFAYGRARGKHKIERKRLKLSRRPTARYRHARQCYVSAQYYKVYVLHARQRQRGLQVVGD